VGGDEGEEEPNLDRIPLSTPTLPRRRGRILLRTFQIFLVKV